MEEVSEVAFPSFGNNSRLSSVCHHGIPRLSRILSDDTNAAQFLVRPSSCEAGSLSAAPSRRHSPRSRSSAAQTRTTPIQSSPAVMSGLEVVGVVLGVLPVAVKAAQGYMTILSSMKDAHRNLKALIRDLETEHIRLQTTCELLLDGIAPPSVIDKLIQNPFGPDWKPYNDHLRLRLWTTAGKFEEQVAEMQNAANELRTKLCLEPDGSVGRLLALLRPDSGRTD